MEMLHTYLPESVQPANVTKVAWRNARSGSDTIPVQNCCHRGNADHRAGTLVEDRREMQDDANS